MGHCLSSLAGEIRFQTGFLDGLPDEVCQRLRSAPETRQTPIVFLTALHELEDHVKAMDVGGDDILTKPINKLELLTRVKSLLRVRALTEQVQEQRRLIHALLRTYVSEEAAQRFLADPTSVSSLDNLKAAGQETH